MKFLRMIYEYLSTDYSIITILILNHNNNQPILTNLSNFLLQLFVINNNVRLFRLLHH